MNKAKQSRVNKDDLLFQTMNAALREQLPEDLQRERKLEQPKAPDPVPLQVPVQVIPQEQLSLPNTYAIPQAPQPRPTLQTFGIPGTPARPLAKSKRCVKIGAYIEPETKGRLDEIIFRFSKAGAQNDMSDLVEAGLSRLLDQIDEGLSGSSKPDVYDVLDDVEQFLDDILKDGQIAPDFFGRAEELRSKIQMAKE